MPGAVDGWIALLERFGRLKMEQVLAPAIEYAENGFPVSEIIANQWASQVDLLRKDEWASKTYLVNGRAPSHGQIVSNKNLGGTFRKIAAAGRKAFYEGEIAEKIVRAVRALSSAVFDPQGEVSIGFKRLLAYVVARTHGCHY